MAAVPGKPIARRLTSPRRLRPVDVEYPGHQAARTPIVTANLAAGLPDIARRLAEAGRRFDTRGWVLGTSGNFSAVITRDPLRLAITASGAWKGDLTAAEILEIDADLNTTPPGSLRPSAETRLHLEIVRL